MGHSCIIYYEIRDLFQTAWYKEQLGMPGKVIVIFPEYQAVQFNCHLTQPLPSINYFLSSFWLMNTCTSLNCCRQICKYYY